ncbi:MULTISPECIES: HAMP domain-containing sensor histidine kinase [unclassified Exiguobacterium]|uniref:two-component system sensor histidine kinase NtrB n=1 Tax=unclassified Exiguobacterium TaxID=2644629 RepID=UPI000B594B88|nr:MULTISPECIES: HAMP domain-containing sensor histidine kinase [unclassified Exiguobacterium]ASI34799.1 two-component sensor histidine kinase [Exiguobacterium sp. N4-1P]
METKKMMRSYFFQITAVLFILICLVIAALAFTADRVTISRVEQQTEKQSENSVEVSSNALRDSIGNLHEEIMGLQLNVDNMNELERVVRETNLLDIDTGFKSFFYYDLKTKKFTWFSSEDRRIRNSKILEDDDFLQALTSTDFHMSKRYPLQSDYLTYMYVPVRNGSERVGIFGGGLSLMNSLVFRNSLESFDDETMAYLFNSKGEPLATSRNLVTDKERVLTQSVVDRAFQTVEPYDIFSTNKDMYYFARDLKVTDWKILVRTPRSVFYEPVYTTRQQYLVIAALTLVLSLIVGYLMSRQLTAPLLELVQKIEKSTTPQPIELERSGSNEVKTLVSAYNEYAQRMENARVEQLSQQQAMLHQEKLASLGQLAAGIAHEIRNPLTPVKMTLQLLTEQENNSPEMLALALSELDRANAMIETMLDLSKGGGEVLKMSMIDMNEFMKKFKFIMEAEARLHAETYAEAADCKIYTPAHMPNLYASENGLSQILSNCVRNALQAVQSRGADGICHLHLHVYTNQFVFIVQDNGVGMTEPQLETIGQAFKTSKADGNGLGLYMSSRIVREHNGKIEFDSKVGVGTTVQIHLPRGGDQDEV